MSPRLFPARFLNLASILAAGLLLASCASTSLRDSWYNSQYQGPAFNRIFVLAIHNTTAERRILEDAMSAAIDVTGSTGIRGYQYLPGDDKAEEAGMSAAIQTAHADALMMIRLKAIETRTQVSAPVVYGPSFGPAFYGGFGWYGWYDAWYASPSVYQYDVATIETSLFDAKTKQLIWSGTSETVNPFPVTQKAPELCAIVVKALQLRQLLPAAP